MVSKNAKNLLVFFSIQGKSRYHQDRDYMYTEKLNTFEFKVQESKNYRFYWLTTKTALQEHCEH